MGGYDSAQIADLVGLYIYIYIYIYIYNTLMRIVDLIQIGVYHDDGILYIPNSDDPKCS